jgi:hypothetical protein
MHSRVAVRSLCYSPRVTQPLQRVTAGVMFVVVCAAPLMERWFLEEEKDWDIDALDLASRSTEVYGMIWRTGRNLDMTWKLESRSMILCER